MNDSIIVMTNLQVRKGGLESIKTVTNKGGFHDATAGLLSLASPAPFPSQWLSDPECLHGGLQGLSSPGVSAQPHENPA